MKLNELKTGSKFHSSEIDNVEDLKFMIVEDHIYTITNSKDLILAFDEGNGYGAVLETHVFESENELEEFLSQDFSKYIH